MTRQIGKFKINGKSMDAIIEPHMLLVDVIRDQLGLTGTKRACASGNCGACTILADGLPICSCLTLAITAQDKDLRTVEGLRSDDGKLDPLQQAFIDFNASQCGFCTSGMLMSARALLDANPRPTREDVKRGLSGNICRCTGYVKIIDAVLDASQKINSAKEVRS